MMGDLCSCMLARLLMMSNTSPFWRHLFCVISFPKTMDNPGLAEPSPHVTRLSSWKWSCVGYKKENFCALQTFLAPMSQVFPAEDDVNKHVDDNCKSTQSAVKMVFCYWWQEIILFYLTQLLFSCFLRFPYVLEWSYSSQQRQSAVQQGPHLC